MIVQFKKATEHYSTYEYKQMAPCILPELNKIQEVCLSFFVCLFVEVLYCDLAMVK